MIKIENCSGCGRNIVPTPVGGQAELTPLDAQEATRALIAGRTLWRLTATSVTNATPAILAALRNRGNVEGPCVLQDHVCREGVQAPAWRPPTPSAGKETPVAPKGRENGVQRFLGTLADRSTRSSARPTEPSGAPSAARCPSDGPTEAPRCSGCGQPCEDGAYASAALGELVVWAHHVTLCEENR